ncbi:response regulator transcription factor [Intrasporangium mesophilum]
MTSVVIVDDHRLVRAGLCSIIESVEGITVVGEAGDGAEAVEVVARVQPDVVVMDLSMPGVDGVEAIRRLRAAGSSAPVVVLTSFAERERVDSALRAGAVGYLLKDSEPNDVVAAIRSAAAGHAPIDARVARALLPVEARASVRDAGFSAAWSAQMGDLDGPVDSRGPVSPGDSGERARDGLSRREREVLAHVAKGLANKQIARALGISERTVKVHLGNVFRQIGVADRTSAALWARDHGIA